MASRSRGASVAPLAALADNVELFGYIVDGRVSLLVYRGKNTIHIHIFYQTTRTSLHPIDGMFLHRRRRQVRRI
jgi:hypothetical protein